MATFGHAGRPGASGRSGHQRAQGEVHLDDGADPAQDPTLLLRMATAAARTALPHRARLARSAGAARHRPGPDPWPAGASDDLVALLLEGHDAIPVLESLDQTRPHRPGAARVGTRPQRARSATPTTASPWTATCGRRRPTPPSWRPVSTARTCSCWARCSTTWARATRATTPWSGWSSSSASATGWASRRRTSRCSRRSSATTSCCPTSPPGAT